MGGIGCLLAGVRVSRTNSGRSDSGVAPLLMHFSAVLSDSAFLGGGMGLTGHLPIMPLLLRGAKQDHLCEAEEACAVQKRVEIISRSRDLS